MSRDVEQTNSGVRKKGKWEEVAEFAEEVEEVLENVADDDSLEELRSWRPKRDEDEEDMKEKTVQVATINKNKMEKESNGISNDLKEASENVLKAGKKASEREAPKEEISEASKDFTRPWVAKASKFFRKIENVVYDKFALRSNRYYLDTEDLSADLKTTRDGMYQMNVNVNAQESRRTLKESFRNE